MTSKKISYYGQTATGMYTKEFGFPAAGKDFFESLFASVHPDKKDKARDALNGIHRFLHLGSHEQASQSTSNGEPVVNRRDARFALILAQAAFGYMTPGS